MSTQSYSPPVDKLLTYGDARKFPEWPDYLALGIGPEHIPDLIRMATDPALLWTDPEALDIWSPVHAWRTLGQLRAIEAIDPLITLLDESGKDDGMDDWILDELPEVFAKIGEAAIPALVTYLSDDTHLLYARVAASNALKKIAENYPDTRFRCVTILTDQLAKFENTDIVLNSFIIGDLMDLEAVESAVTIKAAFAAKQVDLTMNGTWYDVKEELGLDPSVEVPGPEPEETEIPSLLPLFPEDFFENLDKLRFGDFPDLPANPVHKPKADSKAKAKRKQEKKSRKQNRKRK